MQIIRPERNKLYHSAVNPMLGVSAGGTSWLVDEIWVEPKELEFLNYEQDVTARFEELQALQQIHSNSIDYARSKGVENEWEMVSFFASEQVNAPPTILQYVDDNGELVTFTEDELELIRNWQPGEAYPIKGLEGHHIETIRENPNDIQLASDSDNIILATDIGHREHLHGGSTLNPTQEAYAGVKLSNEERLSETIAFNESEIVPGFFEAASAAMTSTVIVGVTIGQVITLYQLKNDPRPWSEKRKTMAKAAIVSTVISAGAGAVAFSANSILDASFSDVSVGTMDHFFADMIGMNGSILAVQLAMATFSYVRAIKKRDNAKQAFHRYKEEMITAVAELAAFSVIGIGLELGADMLGGLLVDALIPDPTGVLIALRVGYSLFKIGSKMYNKKKHQEAYIKCIDIRQHHYYDVARATVY